MKVTSILVGLALVLGIASAASAVTVYTDDPSWTYPELADPAATDITHDGWTQLTCQSGGITWTWDQVKGFSIDNDLTTYTGGRWGSSPGMKMAYQSDQTIVAMYTHPWDGGAPTVSLYDSLDNVVYSHTQASGGKASWYLFDSPTTFRYYKVDFAGTDWQGLYETIFYTPEPTTVAILGLGSLVLLRKRR